MRIDGMDALILHLERGAQIEEKVKEIVKKRTAEMNRKAQRYAPVDTGELRRSIVSTYQNGGLVGLVQANMHYAPYIEYGTRFMVAQPFMRPAFYEVVFEFQDDLKWLVR